MSIRMCYITDFLLISKSLPHIYIYIYIYIYTMNKKTKINNKADLSNHKNDAGRIKFLLRPHSARGL